jgi:hypothetical protein
VHHQRPGRTTEGWRTAIQGHPGFPDLVLLRPPELIFAELKSDRGITSRAQDDWLRYLGAVPGVKAFVWQPADWRSGDIERALGKR